MPHEVSDFEPALRFLAQEPGQNLMLIRSLRLGPRPGFAVIVDHPITVRAVMAVTRPDWKKPDTGPMTLQIDASDRTVALSLLSWLPAGPRYRVLTYRAWLQDLVRSLLVVQRHSHMVHCLATAEEFNPSQLGESVREIDGQEQDLRLTARRMHTVPSSSRLFGLVEDEELVAFSTLAQPDTDYVTVQTVYTRESARSKGLGRAVLSAATEAGLATGKIVSFGLPAEDLPALRMLAGLGFVPSCREWTLEGVVER